MSKLGLGTLFLASLALGACVDDTTDLSTSEMGLHVSGVCRIEGHSHWLSKEVEFYRISDPEDKWISFHCDPWVGTSECCSRFEALGLTYDECVQLRHNPDCPRPGGGGGGGPGGPGGPGDGEVIE
jgi:hypothetical protein